MSDEDHAGGALGARAGMSYSTRRKAFCPQTSHREGSMPVRLSSCWRFRRVLVGCQAFRGEQPGTLVASRREGQARPGAAPAETPRGPRGLRGDIVQDLGRLYRLRCGSPGDQAFRWADTVQRLVVLVQ